LNCEAVYVPFFSMTCWKNTALVWIHRALFFLYVCENSLKTETLLMENNLLAFFILIQKKFVMSFAALG